METIVEYRSDKKPLNAYPKRIISPAHPQQCCTTRMVQVGKAREDQRGFSFYYRSCQECGFTLRHFLPVMPPERSPLIHPRQRFVQKIREAA